MRITENINYDTSLDACKGHTTLKVGNSAAGKIPAVDKADIEAENDFATYIYGTKYEITDKYSSLGI